MNILIGVEVFWPINLLTTDNQVFKNQIPDSTSCRCIGQKNGIDYGPHLENPKGRQVHRGYLGQQWLYFGK